MRVMECIKIRPDQIGTEKKENCKFTNVQVLNLLVLFPFFVVRNAYRYSGLKNAIGFWQIGPFCLS